MRGWSRYFSIFTHGNVAKTYLIQCRSRQFLRRSAFPMTIESDRPIAAAQRIGLMNPAAASGTTAAL